MRLTEIPSAGGTTARAAQERAGDAATRRTALGAGLAALERDVGMPEDTKAGTRAEPV